jgi:hypothetical protein
MIDLHDLIPGNLGDDRGRGNGDAPGITLDNHFLGYVDGNFALAVDQEIIRGHGKAGNGFPHGQKRCLQDIHVIDNGGLSHAYIEGDGITSYDNIQLFSLGFGEFFGIIYLRIFITGREHNSSSYNGAGQRTSSGLINAGYMAIAIFIGVPLKTVHRDSSYGFFRMALDHIAIRAGQSFLDALPALT